MNSTLYEKSKIGKKVADGGDRKVYMYDDYKVIKISSLSFFAGRKLHTKLVHDYEVCKEYFKDFVVETENVGSSDGYKHIEIQPFIKGEMLAKKHMNYPTVKLQFIEISNSLKQMISDGNPPIDLVGNIGMIYPYLSNIMIDNSNKLRIIDTTLLEGKTIRPLGLILEFFAPLILARQNYLMRKFLR